MRAIDFLIEKYVNKARLHIEGLNGKGKTLIKFRKFLYEINMYYGNTRLSSARAALETARRGRFLDSADRAAIIPLLEENFNGEAGVWSPSQGYYFKIERVTTTVKTEFISSTSNNQKLKVQLAKKEKENDNERQDSEKVHGCN